LDCFSATKPAWKKIIKTRNNKLYVSTHSDNLNQK
jgi:hypothetical protein